MPSRTTPSVDVLANAPLFAKFAKSGIQGVDKPNLSQKKFEDFLSSHDLSCKGIARRPCHVCLRAVPILRADP
jgi:hypothetical protein